LDLQAFTTRSTFTILSRSRNPKARSIVRLNARPKNGSKNGVNWFRAALYARAEANQGRLLFLQRKQGQTLGAHCASLFAIEVQGTAVYFPLDQVVRPELSFNDRTQLRGKCRDRCVQQRMFRRAEGRAAIEQA